MHSLAHCLLPTISSLSCRDLVLASSWIGRLLDVRKRLFVDKTRNLISLNSLSVRIS